MLSFNIMQDIAKIRNFTDSIIDVTQPESILRLSIRVTEDEIIMILISNNNTNNKQKS